MKYEYQIKKLLAIFIASTLVTVIITPLRGIDLGINATIFSSFAGLIGYFIFTNYICKHYGRKIPPKYILLAILLGISVLQVPIRIIDLRGTIWSLPDFLVHLSGIIGGYIYYKNRWTLKKAIIYITAIYCLGCVCIYIAMNVGSYNTLLGVITPTATSNFTMKGCKEKDTSLSHFRGKYLVVDCWYEQCGVCFHEFPNFQKLCYKYSSNKDVTCISLNIHYPRDEKDPKQMIRDNGYTFPVYVLTNVSVRKELKLDCFPIILIFNKENKLIYRGSLNEAELLLKHYI